MLGCLLGQQAGRVVDISNSLELKFNMGEHALIIDEIYMAKKQEQCTYVAQQPWKLPARPPCRSIQ